MELVFNELSAIKLPSLLDARRVMSQFLGVLIAAVAVGFERAIRASIDLGSHLLMDDYPVSRWRNDPEVDRDEKLFFRLLTSRYPLDQGDAYLHDCLLGCEYRYGERPCTGLGAADILGTVSASFALANDWDAERVIIQHLFLDEDTGDYKQESISVPHPSKAAHIRAQEKWVLDRRRGVLSGADLYDRRQDVLSRLIFCQESAGQLRSLSEGHPMLHPVAKKLFAFQDYASSWRSGAFDPSKLPMKVTPEREATMAQFGETRIFKMPDGSFVSLPWHARLTGRPWRVHFGWDNKARTIIIGYIGTHLPTAMYRT
jgi:hypothetical protein